MPISQHLFSRFADRLENYGTKTVGNSSSLKRGKAFAECDFGQLGDREDLELFHQVAAMRFHSFCRHPLSIIGESTKVERCEVWADSNLKCNNPRFAILRKRLCNKCGRLIISAADY